MEFRIADTFTDSLAKLTNQEQKAVKTTAFDLQMNPANPGIQLHKLSKSKDKNFWSGRVGSDIRLIVHKTSKSFLLCYVGHHDDAYGWAERRKIEKHPKTGAAQIVEVRETIREVPVYVEVEQPTPEPVPLFDHVTDDVLLSYGVPAAWLDAVRVQTEDQLLDVAEHLPAEAAEALLMLATGETPPTPEPLPDGADPFEHPDARRRFRTIDDHEELQRALDAPWEKWAVFLHPTQRRTVERAYNGPARVAGSAGTGKTVVALHRAVFLAEREPDARVLLTTFSDPLANALEDKLRSLISNRPKIAERLDVDALDTVALRLHQRAIGEVTLADADVVAAFVAEAASVSDAVPFPVSFLVAEWRDVVDAWQLDDWEAYRTVPRVGRGSRLPQAQRETIWSLFDIVREKLTDAGLTTMPSVYGALARHYTTAISPYEFAVVDEAQDLGVAQLRFLAAMVGGRPDGIFLAGDLGQRIFQPPFSWKELGVDVRGRSKTLRINYRTSHQIRRRADLLLSSEIEDVDGNVERRDGTRSVFNGPDPVVIVAEDAKSEVEAVSKWLASVMADGIPGDEIGIIVRSDAEVDRARQAAEAAGLSPDVLDGRVRPAEGRTAIGTMHLAKGLEFRAVAVMACDDEVVPLQARVETATSAADVKEVYDTERHLLYVACTRARDRLLVSGSTPASEFLSDLTA